MLGVKRHLSLGTTTAVYFGTIHKDATIKLADVIEKSGQRFVLIYLISCPSSDIRERLLAKLIWIEIHRTFTSSRQLNLAGIELYFRLILLF
jgi:cytosine/adenosine deaminase-related metal-dependent hydrolase